MRDGSVRTNKGRPYKPSVLRSYETSMRLRVLPELGGARLSDIDPIEVMREGLDLRGGLSPQPGRDRASESRIRLSPNSNSLPKS